MKLIGGKDYYDGVTGFGYETDDRRAFVRTNFNKAVPRAKDDGYQAGTAGLRWDAYITNDNGLRSKEADLHELHVIFCGRHYKGVVRRESVYHKDSSHWSQTFHTFWNPTAIQAELVRQKAKIRQRKAELWAFRSNAVSEDTLDAYFEPADVSKADLDKLIRDNVVHSIGFKSFDDRYGAIKWHDNTDGLKMFGFASAVDPWQAYQQIDMWIGSQLAKEEDNMVKLSDKELIAKHGFDQVSFRNTHHAGKPRGKA